MKHHPDLRAAVARAVARARNARRRATLYDLFAALVETPDVYLLLHQMGADAEFLSSALDSAASSTTAGGPHARRWLGLVPDPSFGEVVARASYSRSGTSEDLGPVDVFAAGFDSGDRVLTALLETAGLTRAGVRRWLAEDPLGGEDTRGLVPPKAPGVLAAIGRRLAWRVLPADDAGSTDAVIAGCVIASLAVWIAHQRYLAGASAIWYPYGIPGTAWYGAGLLALAWVVHRVSGTLAGFRSVLAPIVGWVPLALAFGVALHYAPVPVQRPLFFLLAAAGFVHVGRILAAAGARRPRAAILAAAVFAGVFAWGSQAAYVNPTLWFAASSDDVGDEWGKSERLLFEQADRIDAAAARVLPGEPGRPSVFFVGFAGTGEQKVFAEETKLAERVISERYGAAGRTVLLVNDRRDLETSPLATVHGLRRALRRLAERMDESKDVLFLFMTSHGSAGSLSVSNSTWPLEQLDPKALREALDASGIRWRVIVVCACYSGSFIPALANEETAIFTSAADDRTSFGCSDDRDATEFGEAFIRDAVPRAPSLAAAFEEAKEAVADRERRRNYTESLPQKRIGAAMSAHWELVEALHGPATAPRQVSGKSSTASP